MMFKPTEQLAAGKFTSFRLNSQKPIQYTAGIQALISAIYGDFIVRIADQIDPNA
jgi:hypothetical protein